MILRSLNKFEFLNLNLNYLKTLQLSNLKNVYNTVVIV